MPDIKQATPRKGKLLRVSVLTRAEGESEVQALSKTP